MAEYIEREAAIDCLHFVCVPQCRQYAQEEIKKIPAADMRPVVRGKWEDVEVTYVADKTTLPLERISSMRCNQCNRYHTEIFYYGDPTEMVRFCPNCGAKMEES